MRPRTRIRGSIIVTAAVVSWRFGLGLRAGVLSGQGFVPSLSRERRVSSSSEEALSGSMTHGLYTPCPLVSRSVTGLIILPMITKPP